MMHTGGSEQLGLFSKAELERLQCAIKADFAELKCSRLRGYIGLMIAQTAAIVALVKLILGRA